MASLPREHTEDSGSGGCPACGQLLEVVPKVGFRYALEGGKLTVPPKDLGGTVNHSLTIGDPEGIRTAATLQAGLDRLARYLPYLASWGAYGVPLIGR